ncbi:hypothetical protein EB796_004022 [Bugula neritina]|uniref:Uncharacterized protein n=1 Tax=Bugula neritina TaxID=10212 RepID=A0A7J7KG63_BUGNE|nr:hypothetical protein EB796_004022 [Bugula neritina]
MPKHLGGLQKVPSDIPLCVLIVNRIVTLLVKALALHLYFLPIMVKPASKSSTSLLKSYQRFNLEKQ